MQVGMAMVAGQMVVTVEGEAHAAEWTAAWLGRGNRAAVVGRAAGARAPEARATIWREVTDEEYELIERIRESQKQDTILQDLEAIEIRSLDMFYVNVSCVIASIS